MNIRLTEEKMIELFIEIDDLLKAYATYQSKTATSLFESIKSKEKS